MEIAKLILEYIKTFLSAHIVIGIVIIIFFRMFKDDVKALMLRIAKITLPGGGELLTSQSEKMPERDETPPNVPSASTAIPENLSLTPEQVNTIREIVDAEHARATLWEYRYLNYFLAPTTQRVLDWLATLKISTTILMFDSYWLPVVPNAEERKAIINALQAHHLIQLKNEVIEVTPNGREYITWRDPISIPAT